MALMFWSRLTLYLWRHRWRSTVVVVSLSFVTILLLSCWLGLGICSKSVKSNKPSHIMEFTIQSQWDGRPVDHSDIKLEFTSTNEGLRVEVVSPFFNDPPNPGSEPGKPKQGLWNYEVVELFFLNSQRQYLEVELCPHGQHLVLLLSDVRKSFKELLPLNYQAHVDGIEWHGSALIPWNYFPPAVNRFNAYAIHGSGSRRTYEALYPVPHGRFSDPDFHRLEFFGEINFELLLSNQNTRPSPSQFWPPAN